MAAERRATSLNCMEGTQMDQLGIAWNLVTSLAAENKVSVPVWGIFLRDVAGSGLFVAEQRLGPRRS